MTAKKSGESIADIYELSPMQEAMLFHSAYAPDSRAYFDQFSCVIKGLARPDCFRRAWQLLADRHAVLRTSFHWEELPKPVQVVHAQVTVPWFYEDWSTLPPSEQRPKWQDTIEQDRRRGFDLERAPLLRCHLVRIDSNTHLFAWSHHHIILDGWCLSLVLDELCESYKAFCNNRIPATRPTRPYRDYIAWLQRQDAAAARDYWSAELKGFSAPTELSAISPIRSRRTEAADSRLSASLSADLSDRLSACAARQHLTVNTIIQGAWSVLLNRYSGDRDIVFGATMAGRSADVPGIQQMLGVFINTVPARVEVTPDAQLIPWLKKLQEQHARRLEHSFISLKDVQQLSAAPPGTPLFHTNLVLMNYPLSRDFGHRPGEFTITDISIFEHTDLPLLLEITPRGEWQIEAVYDSSTMDEDWIRRLTAHLINLVTGFVEYPEQQIGAFQILTHSERHQLIEEFNHNKVEFDSARTLVHRLEENAELFPNQVVIECEERVLQARLLNRGANQMARRLLSEIDLEPDDRVALLMPRSERLAETILAVWKCGAAYVPVDPRYPEARIKNIVERAAAKIVVTEKGHVSAQLLRELEAIARVVDLDDIGRSKSLQDGSNLGLEISPDSLAYVIFTSGSTGEPKGAMVEHAGMLNHILAKVHDLGITNESIIAQTASHCFDISLWQMFTGPLMNGKTIIYTDEVVLEPDRLIERAESDAVTVMELVPSYLSALLDRAEERTGVFAKLRWLAVTGEAVSYDAMRRWFERFPGIPVANLYGPTECSDNITHHTMYASPKPPYVPIGRPLRNFNIYVVDEWMNLCPVGVKGEICASGLGVGRGYLGDSALTAAAFAEDPFIGCKGVRLYKTGDLGCYLPDGNLILFGRKDRQIKIRGFRIELGEIEAALARIEGVREAVVVDRRDPDKEPYLCAYLTAKNGSKTNAEAIARELALVLPEYMVPAAFVEMSALPLTPNGKVNRKALPAPSLARGSIAANYVAPRSETEKQLAEVWSAALGVTGPGIHDNFFSLGGDSILSMQVVSRAKRAGLKLAVSEVFRHPTIADLARHAVKMVLAIGAGRTEAAPNSSGPAPLTPIQRRFFETTTVDPHHYNQSVMVEMPGGVDPKALETALHVVVERHQSLRLRFPLVDGVCGQQVCGAPGDFPFMVRDLAGEPDERQRQVMETAADELQGILNLSDGPLIAAALFLKSGPGASLLLVIHHLCIDAVSWGILFEDLVAAYQQLSEIHDQHNQDVIRLPEATASYQEWSNRLADYAKSEDGDCGQRYWLNLARTAAAAIPVDFTAGLEANTVESGSEVWVELDEADSAALLKEAPLAYSTRIDEMLLTALALALTDWTGGDKVMVDLEKHGREAIFDDLDISRTVGWFTALCPVVLQVSTAARDLGVQLKSIKEQCRRIPKGGLGYGLLRYYSPDQNVRNELSGMPPVQVLFNYLGQPEGSLGNSGWKADIEAVGAARSPRQLRDHFIEINGLVAGGQLKLSFSYSRNLHKRDTVERLARGFKHHLGQIIEHCRQPGAGGFTPSDAPLASLNQDSLDVLFEALKTSSENHPMAVMDIYGLSPAQQGMLFHSLYTARSNAYFNRLSCVIEGPLDVPVFREAWARVIEHHPSLRASFHWEGLQSPVQVVHGSAPAEWLYEDASQLSPGDCDRRWERYVRDDRDRRFDLGRPPLIRFGLLRTPSGSHRFNWSYHHLLLDGWSVAIVLKDVLVAYESILYSKPVQLGFNREFRDNIEWLSRCDTAGAEVYWREKLKGVVVPTPLMLGEAELEGLQRPGESAEEEALVSTDLTARLHEFARECGITLNTIAQAAWALLLSRYSGEQDVVFGSIVSGRPPELEGAENMVGVFINTLPTRVQVDLVRTKAAWLKAIQIEQGEREQYAYSSLVDIQRWSEAPSGTPLFESILIFENYPIDDFLLRGAGGLSLTEVQAYDPNNYPITLVVTPAAQASKGAVALKVMYDDGRFDRTTIRRLIGHYEAAVRQLSHAPEQSVGAFDILSEAELAEILRACNGVAVQLPENKTFLDLFEDNASSFGESCAVRMDSVALTYEELKSRANRLAERLMRARPLRRGDRVAVLMHRSLSMVEAVLAIWKCGAAYVPIDPEFPLERIKVVIGDSGAAMVLTDVDDRIGRLIARDLGIGIVTISTMTAEEDELRNRRSIQEEEPVNGGSGRAALSRTEVSQPDDLAYVIYTSGSTGKPKGAMIEHRGMLNHLLAMASELELGPGSRVAQTASHCFDISVWQFFAALAVGGRTIIYSDETVVNPAVLVDRIEADGVEVIQFVPSYLAVFLDELEIRRPRPLFVRLKWLILIGEILKPGYVRRWFDLFDGVKMMNAYGPTEASDSVTHHVMELAPSTSSIPIGRPIQNMHVYVMDGQMKLCPIGVKGEICIGGAGVGRGYLGDPDRTRASFMDDPFSNDPGGRLYRTGDIGCLGPAGRLFFFGREDHQVKIRGHRLELGEIENALVNIEGVQNAAVVVRERRGQKALYAFVSLKAGAAIDPSDLKLALSSRLPIYMAPDAIHVLPDLPLNSSGKVDRKSLPEIDNFDGTRLESSEPITQIQREVAEVWKEVLAVENTGIDDRFVDLGGHSLNAIQIVGRIRNQLRREISFADVFDFDTVRSLAARVEELGESSEIVIPRVAPSEDYETSHAQKRIWLASMSTEGMAAYNMHSAIWIDGPVDGAALREAFQSLVDRHESLRTIFVTRHGELRQRIIASEDVSDVYQEIDFRGAADAEELAGEAAVRQSAEPFVLTRGPLVRATLLRVGESRCLLALTMHHIIGDAWSLQVVFDELIEAYGAVLAGSGYAKESLPIQYKDYAQWHNRWLRSSEAARDRVFWFGQLLSAPPCVSLPADASESGPATFQGDSVRAVVDAGLGAALRRLAQSHGTSVYVVILSCIYALVYRYTGRQDIVIGTQTAGRGPAQLESQVGCFLNTLGLRAFIRGTDTAGSIVRTIAQSLSEALAHQMYPFDELLGDLKRQDARFPAPLFEIQVDYAPNLMGEHNRPGSDLRISELIAPKRTTKHPISFLIEESAGGRLTLEIVYSAWRYRRESIAALAARFQMVLRAFTEDDSRTLESIELGTPPRGPRRVKVDLKIPSADCVGGELTD
jgi:amino acid adenylation domain-containing protein/non-ribosomal peptide synthase protein (TIGR01720 family)